MSTLHLRTVSLLTRWRPNYRISCRYTYIIQTTYLGQHRMGAGCLADDAEACSQLQFADSVQEAEHLWVEHCTAGLLDYNFRAEEVEDRCCIADIAGEGGVRIYFQISIISPHHLHRLLALRLEDQIRLYLPILWWRGSIVPLLRGRRAAVLILWGWTISTTTTSSSTLMMTCAGERVPRHFVL